MSARACHALLANNDWSMSLAGELRFYFDIDYKNSAEIVRDRLNPGASDWKIVNAWPYRKIPADYAIVSRVRHSTTEQTADADHQRAIELEQTKAKAKAKMAPKKGPAKK